MVAGFLDWVTIFIKLFSKLGSEAAISQHCVRSFVSSGTASRKKKNNLLFASLEALKPCESLHFSKYL